MKYLSKLLFLSLCLGLFVILAIPALAQEVGPGEGAPVLWPNFGADIATLNPILAQDGSSNRVNALLYPAFLGVDSSTGNFGQGIQGQIVDTWSISDDGLTYTFTLREDYNWSDGTPITSADVKYVWDAMQDADLRVNGNLASIKSLISSVEAPDPRTVVMTFQSPDCNALNSASKFIPVPAHIFQELYGSDYNLMNDSDYNLNPTVTGGPFKFQNFRPGEQVTLLANLDFPDSPIGYVAPEGYIDKNVTDQTVQVEQFLVGELTGMAGVPSARQQELQDLVDAGQYQGYTSERANYRFIALNIGDPANPQNAFDADGNPIDQGHHPILGDVRVRQALNYAMDFEAINQGAFQGFGFQGSTHSRPDNWAHKDIPPYPYDTDMATALLEEAGWTDTNGDGIRECTSCLYAEPGTELAFKLETNAGNTSQEALGTILQDQWLQIGARVDFQPIDFNVLVEQLQAQTYDAIMIFWGFDFPANPDGELRGVHMPEADVLNSGFNATSFNNARFNELVDQARALPGCDPAELKELYGEAYQILHDESPWIWIGGSQVLSVAQPNVNGFAPNDLAADWNGSLVLYNVMSWQIAP